MDSLTLALRQALTRAAEGRGRPRYPEALRQRVVAHVRDRRARGASLRQLADELGLAVPTLVRWSGPRPAFRPVVITPASPTASGHLVVHGPGGLRVEGLTLEQAAELLRRLA
jgi:transposase